MHPHVGVGRERDRALERHVHRRDAERRRRQHQAVHPFGDRVRDARWRRACRCRSADAARAARRCRTAGSPADSSELRRDLRLRQVGEIAARQHGGFLSATLAWASGDHVGDAHRAGRSARSSAAPHRPPRPRHCRCVALSSFGLAAAAAFGEHVELGAEHVALRHRRAPRACRSRPCRAGCRASRSCAARPACPRCRSRSRSA